MTQDEACNVLEKLGMVEYLKPTREMEGVRCFSCNISSDLKCECNDRPPPLTAYVYPDMNIHDIQLLEGSIVFKLYGEVNDIWYSSKIYSVQREVVEKMFPLISKIAKATWETFWKVCSEENENNA
jgi:hypothetical protein